MVMPHGPAAGKLLIQDGASGSVSFLDVLLKWPLLVVHGVSAGIYVPSLVALGAGYYMGGVPGQGQSWQTYAMAYGAAGVGYYAGLMFEDRTVQGAKTL
jgi:hypothetical protein